MTQAATAGAEIEGDRRAAGRQFVNLDAEFVGGAKGILHLALTRHDIAVSWPALSSGGRGSAREAAGTCTKRPKTTELTWPAFATAEPRVHQRNRKHRRVVGALRYN